MSDLKMSIGRDYNLHGRYEYVIYLDEKIVARKGLFTSYTQAKRAGLKAAGIRDIAFVPHQPSEGTIAAGEPVEVYCPMGE